MKYYKLDLLFQYCYTSPMLIEAKQHRQDALAVHDAQTLRGFMEKYFTRVFVADYPGEVIKSIRESNPDRLSNPDYFRFYALVISGTAEFGFKSAEGQRFRHDKRGFTRDYTDPRHLLALGCYLADLNIQAYDQKMKMLRLQRSAGGGLTPEQEEAIWAATDLFVQSGIVSINFAEARRKRKNFDARTLVCLPDIDRHRRVSRIGFTGRDADRMDCETFRGTKLPLVEAAYGDCLDIRGIFLNGSERWTSSPDRPSQSPYAFGA